jgi:murein DD-endopeptidase MepM/ murein hydrolase activator NlpD
MNIYPLEVEPPPLHLFFPLVFAASSILTPLIKGGRGGFSLIRPPSSAVANRLQAYLFNLGILRFAKKGKKGKTAKRAQKIKSGVQYYWDDALKRWVPVATTASTADPIPQESPQPNFKERLFPIKLIWPLAKGFVITQDFQEHLETKKEKGYKYYNGGLDLAYSDIREGAPVYAAAPGIVKYARWNATGYGNYVVIDHFDPQSSASGLPSPVLGPFSTIYAHLRSWSAMEGQRVNTSQVIGFLGHTGNCWGGPGNPDGTHLHFELRHGTERSSVKIPVDPYPYLPNEH